MSNDSTLKTIIVATLLCVVCSVVVSWSAVSLKPLQTKNKILDVKKNLLLTAGLIDGKADEAAINAAYENVEAKIVDLSTGEYVEMDATTYDARKAAKDPKQNYLIPSGKDLARVKTRAKLNKVYFIKENGETKRIVFPVHGKGLWSTLYGFLVLETDLNTVAGLGFYEHGETPGLGGEVDNPNWKRIWNGKKAFDDAMKPALKVIKGTADASHPHTIDGLSGATLTADGVTGLVRYWLSEDAYGPFIKKIQNQGGI